MDCSDTELIMVVFVVNKYDQNKNCLNKIEKDFQWKPPQWFDQNGT